MIARCLGHLLRRLRAGREFSAWNHPALAGVLETLEISSPWFENNGEIPLRCAGRGLGDNVSPPLVWSKVPKGTLELAIIIEDPDVPLPRPIVHMLAYKLPAERRSFTEGELCEHNGDVRFGRSLHRRAFYRGPRPLPGHGPHRYDFLILALNSVTSFAHPPDRNEFLTAISGHVIGRGRLTGICEQK